MILDELGATCARDNMVAELGPFATMFTAQGLNLIWRID